MSRALPIRVKTGWGTVPGAVSTPDEKDDGTAALADGTDISAEGAAMIAVCCADGSETGGLCAENCACIPQRAIASMSPMKMNLS